MYTNADIYFSSFWKIENGDTRMNNLALTAVHTFDMAAKTARISVCSRMSAVAGLAMSTVIFESSAVGVG